MSQTHYDTRYQGMYTPADLRARNHNYNAPTSITLTFLAGNDALHILMKFCQICVFIYIGAASGNWAPGKLPHVPSLRVFDDEGHETNASTEAGRSLFANLSGQRES